MTVRLCSHRRVFIPMQSDVLNETPTIGSENDCSTSSTSTLIYSGLKLHPKPLVPTISMPGVASPLSIVKKLSLPDAHLDKSTTSSGTPSSIRLVTPTGKSSSSTSKTYIINPQQTTTSSSSSLLTLIPPGTSSPKIQTLTNELCSASSDFSSSNPPLFLAKNRVTLVQPLINTPSSTTVTHNGKSNSNTPKLLIQQNNHSTTANTSFWPPPQATKIFSIPPTAKMLSRPVQLIPSSSDYHHHHHITHVQTVKSDKHETYPLNMQFGLGESAAGVNLPHGHPAYIHMQLFPSSSDSNHSSTSSSSSPVQLTLPNSHLYSSPSSVLISTSQRAMDYNNNHHQTMTTISTPIVREMQIEEKSNELTTLIKTAQSTKNRTRLPLQPAVQQFSSTLTSITPSSSTTTPTTTTTIIRQPKKHKLLEDEQSSAVEPPAKQARPLSKFSIENTTPVETSVMSKKRPSAESANAAIVSRKRRAPTKLVSNENIEQEALNERRTDLSIDDELLKRLSQEFVYHDQRTGLRWIGTKSRPKALSTLVSRFSWKPKINHYEKYSDLIRTNPKRSVPVKSVELIRKKLTQPWASWRVDRLTNYITELTDDEQTTKDQLADMVHLLHIDDPTTRRTIEDLFDANIQRHRSFCEQLTQISSVLGNLLDHGNTLREICSMSKATHPASKRTKER